MATIRKIIVHKCRRLENLEIDLTPANGSTVGNHLILTGPNGSGKTGLLLSLDQGLSIPAPKRPSNGVSRLFEKAGISLEWMSVPSERASIYVYFEALRRLEIGHVSGPNRINVSTKQLGTKPTLSQVLTQFLVNKRTEQAFAQTDGKLDKVQEVREFFDSLQMRLRTIFGDDHLVLEFQRERFDFVIRLGDGYTFNFQQLAHGHMAALHLFFELVLRREWLRDEVGDRTFEPDGVVLIDELETHLHLELQEIVLPFLCEMFPRVQFIVATHSPAVISSVENAVVFDLKKRQPIRSADLQGIRYGTLMTSHFGIPEEYDHETTRELTELKSLRKKSSRSEPEQTRMKQLAETLAAKSHALALDVLIELNHAASTRP